MERTSITNTSVSPGMLCLLFAFFLSGCASVDEDAGLNDNITLCSSTNTVAGNIGGGDTVPFQSHGQNSCPHMTLTSGLFFGLSNRRRRSCRQLRGREGSPRVDRHPERRRCGGMGGSEGSPRRETERI